MKSVDHLVDPIVRRAIEKQKSMPSAEKDEESEEGETLLEHLVKATDGECSRVIHL